MRKQFYSSKVCRHATALCTLIVATLFSISAQAQLLQTDAQTAASLASTLGGPGVTIISPVLTCASAANGVFTIGPISPVGIPYGIVLSTGSVGNGPGVGISQPASVFSTGPSVPSYTDADLAALAGGVTHDACVLEFDFKAVGDTVKFDYVFASEEYPEFACSSYNDVFGFLISGGVTSPTTSYPTPYNIARIPGTSIPVCINSVNSAPTGTSYPVSTCASVGPGSPFGAYYINNSASTTLVYDGMTVVMRAFAPVSPCDTYHLKIGIADVGDDAYDSGVFIRGGSLTSTVPTTIAGVGLGSTGVIRGCNPGSFVFSTPIAQDTAVPIHYTISGTAINGYDYSPIPGATVIPPHATSVTIPIIPLAVPPAGPKVVTVTIYKVDPCHPEDSVVSATASLTILDSFDFHIITPDTAICEGQLAHIRAIGDTAFAGLLSYSWSPGSTLSTTILLTTDATPAVTTTYTLTTTADPSLGCIPQEKTITVSIYPNPVITIDSPLVKTCVGIAVPLHSSATPVGTDFTYTWSPGTYLSSITTTNPVTTPMAVGDITYTVTVYPTALPACASHEHITVHTVPNDFTLVNTDQPICIGESVPVSIVGWSEFNWIWTPSAGVSDPTIMNPILTPTVNTTYSVTASYAHCPNMVHGFSIEVDTPAPHIVRYDTICFPNSYVYDLTVPGSTGVSNGYYHYQWAPATFVSNDTMPAPIITPTVAGSYAYVITVKPHAASCVVNDNIYLYVVPNAINITPDDTAICKGQSLQVLGTGNPVFSYQWLPTTGIAVSDVLQPLIAPDTSTVYKIKVSFHLCPDFYDSVVVDVQPIPTVYAGGNRFVCQYDSLHLNAVVEPAWYTGYNYSWSPAGVFDHPANQSPLFLGHDTTNAILTVTTSAGCIGKDSAVLNVLPGDFASIIPEMDFCPHDSVVLAPGGGVSYHWSPALYLSDSIAAQPVIRPITSQVYTIVATDARGCKDTITFTATVHPGAVFWLEDSVTLYPGETYQIEPQTNCTRFNWSPSGGLSNKYISNPVASPGVSTRYIVTAATEFNCVIKDSIDIVIAPESLIDLPNAFAPGSGPNKDFKIIKRGIATLNYFRIFNRWGNMVFETKDINQGWNGEYNGVPQPVGVYVYQVQATTSTGKIFQKQGNTTLLR